MRRIVNVFRRHPLRASLALLAGLVVSWLGASAAAAWRLTHRPHAPYAEPAPAVVWARLEELRLHTRDGEELGAWLWRGGSSPVCAVLLHGNGDSRRSVLGQAEVAARSGHSFLALSLRAHGDSTGAANDFGWSAREDVIAAVSLLERELPGRKIAIIGMSLGAAAAIFAAEELGPRVAGYLLESPYSDLKTATHNRTARYLPPILDEVAYAGLVLWSHAFLPVAADRISPLERVKGIPRGVPVLLLAGATDEHTRLAEVEAMRERIGPDARVVVFPGAQHAKLWSTDRELYEKSVLQLLAELDA